ncbi:hypothetical protein [Arsenophonus sp. PmNCSU2021_1]|uniref:hypothetical protein n=1 Tax=Arsenophonus sp. PmNCSU2021_1 TaxID=3118989 RepID=UPI002FF3FE9C
MILNILTPVIGMIGQLLIAYSAWSVYPPAGYCAAGIFCLLNSYLTAKAIAETKNGK